MARRFEHEMDELKDRWKQRMYDPEFNDMDFTEQSKEIGVTRQVISKWHNEASPAFFKNVASTIANNHAKYAPKIYLSLIKQAEKGSLGHQELFFKRLEGWSPINKNENLNKNAEFEGKSDEEILIEEMRKRPELIEKLISEKKPPEVINE